MIFTTVRTLSDFHVVFSLKKYQKNKSCDFLSNNNKTECMSRLLLKLGKLVGNSKLDCEELCLFCVNCNQNGYVIKADKFYIVAILMIPRLSSRGSDVCVIIEIPIPPVTSV